LPGELISPGARGGSVLTRQDTTFRASLDVVPGDSLSPVAGGKAGAGPSGRFSVASAGGPPADFVAGISRGLAQLQSPLGSFYRVSVGRDPSVGPRSSSCCGQGGGGENAGARGGASPRCGLFPSYPPRCLQSLRTPEERWAWLQWVVSSWVYSGRATVPLASMGPAVGSAADAAWARGVEAAAHFLALGVAPGGRRAQDVAAAVRELEARVAEVSASRACGPSGERVVGETVTLPGVCKRVQAERASLPVKGGTFSRFVEYLPAEYRAGWLDPEVLRGEPWKDGASSQAKVHASKREWHKLLGRMLAAGMVRFVAAAEVPRGADGEFVTNGFFCVSKDAEHDRTITNRRPRNAVERLIGACGEWLPHGCSLVDLQVGADQAVITSMDDLSDYYHSIPTSDARTATNGLGPPLTRTEAERVRSIALGVKASSGAEVPPLPESDSGWVPCQSTLPMGDGNAVCYGMLGHIGVLKSADLVRDGELVTYRGPILQGSTWEGVVVDDHVWCTTLSRKEAQEVAGVLSGVATGTGPRGALSDGAKRHIEIAERSEAAYPEAGVSRKLAKSRRAKLTASFWGCTLEGERAWVMPKVELWVAAVELSRQVLEIGVATPGVWLGIVGLWTHCFLFRRCLFSLMNAVYQEADGLQPSQVFRISRPAREELWTMVALAPWVFTNLRAQASEVVGAVDASSSWAAVGDTQVAPEMARELWRARNRKGGYVRMLTEVESTCAQLCDSSDPEEQLIGELAALQNGGALGEPLTTRERARSALVGELARGQQFVERVKYRVLPGEHINIKEGRALGSALRRDAGDVSRQDKRAIKLSDSQVNVRAWAKGRSSSWRLNAVIQRGALDQIWGGIYVGLLHVPTEDNPLDDPTRNRKVRAESGPTMTVGRWQAQWAELAVGPRHSLFP